jgi:hypothetical protein
LGESPFAQEPALHRWRCRDAEIVGFAMSRRLAVVTLFAGCLVAPSLADAAEGRGSRGALVGALAAAALAGPAGIAMGAAVGRDTSIAVSGAGAWGTAGIDPMPTCGTGKAEARGDAAPARTAKAPC